MNSPVMDPDESRLSAAISTAVSRILRALVRVLLRHGVSYRAFTDLAKRAYIDVAKSDFGIPGRKPSISRVAVLTGLTRKEIQKFFALTPDDGGDVAARYNRAAQVVSGWVRDPEFCGADGQPASLPVDGAEGSFASLVRRHSGDMPTRAVLDELLRVGTVEKQADGRVRLLTRAYVPRSSEVDKLGILGTDAAELITTIEHNIAGEGTPRFQRKVMYDNLSTEAVEKFREIGTGKSQALIEFLDSWLARHDRDMNPGASGSGRMKAGIGIYYYEENLESQEERRKS